jgi:hypothetical protein
MHKYVTIGIILNLVDGASYFVGVTYVKNKFVAERPKHQEVFLKIEKMSKIFWKTRENGKFSERQ